MKTLIALFLFTISFNSACAPVTVSPWKTGNAVTECANIGEYAYAFKIDNWDDLVAGDYAVEFPNGHTNVFTISNNDGTYFDWASLSAIEAVIVKGGPDANVNVYGPLSLGDTLLYSPLNKGGKVAEVSHVTFCWNPPMLQCE